MARKYTSRRNAIKLGWIGLGIFIIFGIFATVNDTFVPTIVAVPFTIPLEPLPLEIVQEPLSLLECRVWSEGTVTTEGGVSGSKITTQAPYVTQVFDPDIRELSIVDIRSGNIFLESDLQLKMKCYPREGALGSGLTVNDIKFTLTGGTITTQWISKDGDGTTKSITSASTKTLPTGSVLVANPNIAGSGIILKTEKITGTMIDNTLTSNLESYFTDPSLIVTVKPDFKFEIPKVFISSESKDVTVSLNSGFGKVKVLNPILDPPKPTSEIVKLSTLKTFPDPLQDDSPNPHLEIRIDLPQWTSAEGSPRYTISRPGTSADTFIEVQKNILITGKQLVDPTTNTYEFFARDVDLVIDPSTPEGQKGKLRAGQWIVEVSHAGRSGTDASYFTVFASDTQGGETVNEPVICPDGTYPPDFSPYTVQDCIKEVDQTPCEEDCEESKPEDNGISSWFPITEFIACLKNDDKSCLNDVSKFALIYGLIGIVGILAIASAASSKKGY